MRTLPQKRRPHVSAGSTAAEADGGEHGSERSLRAHARRHRVSATPPPQRTRVSDWTASQWKGRSSRDDSFGRTDPDSLRLLPELFGGSPSFAWPVPVAACWPPPLILGASRDQAPIATLRLSDATRECSRCRSRRAPAAPADGARLVALRELLPLNRPRAAGSPSPEPFPLHPNFTTLDRACPRYPPTMRTFGKPSTHRRQVCAGGCHRRF